MQGRIMEFMTVDEVRDGLKETQSVILPLGVIEQHGYHLPLNTDVYNCYEVAKRVSEKTGCFVAPPINYSFSGGELPGTFNIHPATLALYLNDILRSLVVMGFKNILVLNGHGGTENVKAAGDAVDMFMRLNPHVTDVCFACAPMMAFAPKCREISRKAGDFHAGASETSRMLYWAPEQVRKEKIVTDSQELMDLFRRDQDAYQVKTKPFNHEFVFPYIKQHPDIAVGVMGNPQEASYDYGKQICQEAVENLSAFMVKMARRK